MNKKQKDFFMKTGVSAALVGVKGYYIGLDTSGFIPGITQGIW